MGPVAFRSLEAGHTSTALHLAAVLVDTAWVAYTGLPYTVQAGPCCSELPSCGAVVVERRDTACKDCRPPSSVGTYVALPLVAAEPRCLPRKMEVVEAGVAVAEADGG